MSPVTSVVIPILNEPRIGEFVAAIHAVLSEQPHEILLVDDGRPVAVPGARVIEGSHHGKGRALRDGILATTGDVVITLDADLGILLPQLPRFIDLVRRDGNDLVIAERQHEVVERTLLRYILSYGLLYTQRLLIFQSFRFADTQCGLKVFRGDVARAIAARQRVDGGMCDIEYLYAAVSNRMKIAQVPVGRIAEERPTRIRVGRALRTDPLALMGIKWRGIRGHYRI